MPVEIWVILTGLGCEWDWIRLRNSLVRCYSGINWKVKNAVSASSRVRIKKN